MSTVSKASLIAGSILVAGALLLLPAALRGFSDSRNIAQDFFAALEQGEYETAYSYLSPELRMEIGSPTEIKRRWKTFDIAVPKLSFGCARGGGSSPTRWRLGFNASLTSFHGMEERSFTLGELREFSSARCSERTVTLDIIKDDTGPKIRAVRVEFP